MKLFIKYFQQQHVKEKKLCLYLINKRKKKLRIYLSSFLSLDSSVNLLFTQMPSDFFSSVRATVMLKTRVQRQINVSPVNSNVAHQFVLVIDTSLAVHFWHHWHSAVPIRLHLLLCCLFLFVFLTRLKST